MLSVSVCQRGMDQLLAADDRLFQHKIHRSACIVYRINGQNNIIVRGNDLFRKVQSKVNTVSGQLDKTVFKRQAAVVKFQKLRRRILHAYTVR